LFVKMINTQREHVLLGSYLYCFMIGDPISEDMHFTRLINICPKTMEIFQILSVHQRCLANG